ncbi:5-oxoprolinase subunit PxpB [Shewanella eurypsychrophilus]|uniref:5-oxoprolinase subunit PxpB n=1 Tax=Shewanella eurypsychrophilus TaxID=2593656 RepID=A0ABX6V073_9GAMM|nr:MULTISPECIES: 5-oxoprolinase subunit PxpB [Shewanella]QFU20424.1 5-oxoprolinase subunit PxpB [Shewanella sp. YLB-09]QPG56001.1 5-oxoprolinase subunit PxpB [Shewanella eurypsychrophilus]
MSVTLQPKLFRFGERALVLDCACISINFSKLEIQKRIWSLAKICHDSGEFEDIVPGNNNLTLFFKDSKNIAFWSKKLHKLLSNIEVQAETGKLIKIPVKYGGEYGPDLNKVAEYNNLDPQEVISIHTSTQYSVLFLGFQPGFPYLDGLDKRLFTPRLANPRLSIPAGSVGIGGEQTGIYPAQSPGGWQLIGRSAVSLFDSALTGNNSAQPSLLSPGDTVQFIAIESLNEIEEARLEAPR